jgi:hypothetical protein
MAARVNPRASVPPILEAAVFQAAKVPDDCFLSQGNVAFHLLRTISETATLPTRRIFEKSAQLADRPEPTTGSQCLP